VNRIELSEKDTMELLEKCPCENLADLGFLDYKVTQPGVGSICIVPRMSFNLVKGFDERFEGWGGEDCAFEMSLDTICGPRYTPQASTIWHLYHPQPETNTYQSPNYPANYALYERYLGANGKSDLMKALTDEK
jgi:predicted glycosyltransferase involved in capsule biosynthesis